MVRAKTELFEVSSVADIAAEASRQLDQAEFARNKCTRDKGDLNQMMKVGMAIAKQVIYKLAESATGIGDPNAVTKEKILSLTREKEALLKKMEQLKESLAAPLRTGVDAVPGSIGVRKLVPTRDDARAPRTRASVARRRVPSSSESEDGYVRDALPLHQEGGSRSSGVVFDGLISGSRGIGPIRHVDPRFDEDIGDFPPLPPLPQGAGGDRGDSRGGAREWGGGGVRGGPGGRAQIVSIWIVGSWIVRCLRRGGRGFRSRRTVEGCWAPWADLIYSSALARGAGAAGDLSGGRTYRVGGLDGAWYFGDAS